MNNEPARALNLDRPQQLSFVRFYKKLPAKSGATVRFFSHTEFYSVHGEDAFLAAEQLFHTNVVKYMGEIPKLEYICLNKKQFDRLVKELLLLKQYRVEVYVKASQTKNVDWKLEYKGSPGNLQQFEDILMESDDAISSSVMAIKLPKDNLVAVANVSYMEGIFHVTEFNDNHSLSDLEALIAQVNPKECLISSGDSKNQPLKALLKRNGVMTVEIPKVDFDADCEEQLNQLLFFEAEQERKASRFTEYNRKHAISCLSAAVKYLNLIGDTQNYNQYVLTSLNVSGYARLDMAAISALNVVPKSIAFETNKQESLFGILNNCHTVQGKRLLELWLKRPLKDEKLINERLDVVEVLTANTEARNMLSSLGKTPDMLKLARKLSTKKASLADFYRIYQIVDNVPSVIAILRAFENTSVNCLLIDPIKDLLTDMEKYQAMIEQTLDMQLAEDGQYLVKASFNENLHDLNKQMDRTKEKMKQALSSAAKDLSLQAEKAIKLDFTDQFGYFYRVTMKEESVLRQNKNYKVIDTIKSGVRFVNKRLEDLNDTYRELLESYEKHQKTIVEEVIEIAADYAGTIRNLNKYIAMIDVLLAFAIASVNAPIPYVRPTLLPMGSGKLILKQARHPCLEVQEGVNCIPNDVEFIANEKTLYIITGPNMGGKSTFMRTVGTTVLLAQIGCFVPCDSAEISIVDCILTRVGAEDCEERGMSTFMMEMVETSSILKSATANSLIIIDELGRGTSTYDGCGIAWAVTEFLAQEVKAFSLFATHYHELTRLSEQFDNVNNLHVTAIVSDTTITPLYEMKHGSCDKSYGIHCAKVAEFPNDVIEFAKEHQKSLECGYSTTHMPQEIIEDGCMIIEDLSKKFFMDQKDLSDEELLLKVNAMKNELKAANNQFLNSFF